MLILFFVISCSRGQGENFYSDHGGKKVSSLDSFSLTNDIHLTSQHTKEEVKLFKLLQGSYSTGCDSFRRPSKGTRIEFVGNLLYLERKHWTQASCAGKRIYFEPTIFFKAKLESKEIDSAGEEMYNLLLTSPDGEETNAKLWLRGNRLISLYTEGVYYPNGIGFVKDDSRVEEFNLNYDFPEIKKNCEVINGRHGVADDIDISGDCFSIEFNYTQKGTYRFLNKVVYFNDGMTRLVDKLNGDRVKYLSRYTKNGFEIKFKVTKSSGIIEEYTEVYKKEYLDCSNGHKIEYKRLNLYRNYSSGKTECVTFY